METSSAAHPDGTFTTDDENSIGWLTSTHAVGTNDIVMYVHDSAGQSHRQIAKDRLGICGRTMTTIAFLTIFLLGAWPCEGEVECVSPVDDYLLMSKGSLGEASMLLAFKADVHGDGRLAVLISTQDALNGKLGNIWTVYLPEGSRYVRAEGSVSLDYDNMLFGTGFMVAGSRLFSLTYPEKDVLVVVRWEVVGRKLTERRIAEIRIPTGEDVDPFVDLLRVGEIPKHSKLVKAAARDVRSQLTQVRLGQLGRVSP